MPNAAGGGKHAEREFKARGQRWSRSTPRLGLHQAEVRARGSRHQDLAGRAGLRPPPQESPERSPDATLASKQRGVPRLPGHAQPASRSPPGLRTRLSVRGSELSRAHWASGPLGPWSPEVVSG